VSAVNNLGTKTEPEWRVLLGEGNGWLDPEALKRVPGKVSRGASKSVAPKALASKTVKDLDREIEQFVEADPLTVVLAEIGKVPASGRFGGKKVFISELWKRVGRRINMTLPVFKQWLFRQLRDGTLLLARADIVAAMDPNQVQDSRAENFGTTVHFVIDPNAPEW
jgi:hypothetical protein